MTGGATGDVAPPESSSRPAAPRFPSQGQLWVLVAAAVVLIAVIATVTHYRAGRDRRRYETLMLTTLDRILTAQEGFFYDSARYVGSLRALPTVRLAPGVHVQIANPDRRSWWGVATHDALKGLQCVVWVGSAPPSFPADVRAPENEAKPVCLENRARPGNRS
jgi:hypothetical protein